MWKSAIYVSIITISFLVYSFSCGTSSKVLNTSDRFYFHPVGVFYALNNVKLSDKVEMYWIICVGTIHSLFLAYKINTWSIKKTMKHTCPVCKCMLVWWICRHCIHGRVRFCWIYMTPMRHHIFLYVLNIQLAIS